MSQKIDSEHFLQRIRSFGFGKKTGIELPGEVSGKLSFTYKSDLANAAFGQGITTTPIQNVKAMTPLTNDGMLLEPHIISKIVDPESGNIVLETKREEIKE